MNIEGKLIGETVVRGVELKLRELNDGGYRLTHHVATSPFQAAALVGEPQASDAFSPGAPARGRNP